MSLTYKEAGVDIDSADATKRAMAKSLASKDARVLNKLGAFASLFEASFPGIAQPVLVLKAEEPGSKQLLALQHGYLRSICFDLINHLINDIAVMGAEPLAVLDTVVCGKLEKEVMLQFVDAMAEACREHGCTLVGGETSEQPGVLQSGRYVLCANVLGVVDKSKIIDGSKITEGDVVLALAANGPHTNGYTLIRRLIDQKPQILSEKADNESFLDLVMRPHRSYLKFLKALFCEAGLKGLAHITGGGIEGNLNRILPAGLGVEIDLSLIKTLSVFSLIKRFGEVPDSDMLKTFNCGVGVALVCSASSAKQFSSQLSSMGCETYPIGQVIRSAEPIRYSSKLNWS